MSSIKHIENSETVRSFGTSLRGTIEATYEELIEAFGEPTYSDTSSDGKVSTEWMLRFELASDMAVVATIYDWKMYDGGTACRSGEKFRWNVGGFSFRALELVEEVLDRIS